MVVSVEQITFVKQGIDVVCQVFRILCVCVCVRMYVCVGACVRAAKCYYLPHTFRAVVCNILLQPFISQKSQSETVF